MQRTTIKNFYEQVSGSENQKEFKLGSCFGKVSNWVGAYYYYYQLKKLAKNQDFSNVIKKHKDICNGKEVIKGTRIRPITILYYIMSDSTKTIDVKMKDLKKDYPSLKEQDIKVAILYYIKKTSFRNFCKETCVYF